MTVSSEPTGERFVIQRRIGAGGMGVVFEAYDRIRQQTVALKKLPEPDPANLYRLKKEFRSLADVAHPNLIPLYELIAEGNDWFFTMELIEGVDFLRYVRPAGMPSFASTDASSDETTISSDEIDPTLLTPDPDEETLQRDAGDLPLAPDETKTVRLVRDEPSLPGVHLQSLRASMQQLAEGINALHNAGKLHCDLKPSNVLVRPNGDVVILDFGLVEELDPFRKGIAMFAGTPAYMSPEQIEMLPISTASDWYAVGVMLYQALTGILPFEGDLYAIRAQKRHSAIGAPRDLLDVPEDLSDLCMALLAHLPEERPTGAEVLARLSGSVPPLAASPPREMVFVGRERELRELWRAYSVVTGGGVATAVVHGRSGLGKSALVHHFLSELGQRDADAVILRGRCYQQESVPYKALDSLIDDLLHYTERFSALELKAIVPVDIAMLARVFPVLEPLETATRKRKRAVDVLDSREVRRRAVAALREIFARLADAHPVVLFIDDIQWGDRDSAAVLAALLQPPDAPPLLTVLTHRSDEAGPRPFLDEMQRLRGRGALGEVLDIPIVEFTFDESRELAALLGGPMPDDRLQSIAREATGSPMFIGEMVRFVTAMGGEHAPANLDDLIRLRVAAMPGAERKVLEMLAVAGQPLERNVLQATIDDEIGNAVLALRSERMIRSRVIDSREALDASHDRFREAVLASMSDEGRRAGHLRLAMTLEDLGRRDPEMLATHYAAAGEPLTAAQHAAAAAANAASALAFDHAARLYRMALDLHPSIASADELRIQLADALTRAGRGFESAPIYLQVAETAEANLALELRRRAAENLLSGGHVEQGLQVMEQVLASVGMKLPATPQRAVLGIILQRIRLAFRGSKYRERLLPDIPADLLLRVEVCWAAAIGLARVDNIRAAYFQAIHLRLALDAGDPYRVARALAVQAGYSSVEGGRGDRRTDAIVQRAEGHARRLNHPHLVGLAALAQTFRTLFLGRFRDALEKANEADKQFRERCTGVAWEIDTTQSCSLCAMYYLGQLAELAPRLNTLLREAEERGDRYSGWNVAGRPSLVWLAMDDADTAIRINQSAIERWSSERFQSQHLFELLASAQIDLYVGRPTEAWQRMERSWPALTRSKILRVQFVRNEMLHLRARVGLAVATTTGDRTVLRQVERDAADILRTKMDWARPLAQSLRAGLRALDGDLDTSRQLLTSAVRNFEKAEMSLYAAAARRRLGMLIGGDEGAALITTADTWLRGQIVKVPEKMVEVLMPGFR